MLSHPHRGHDGQFHLENRIKEREPTRCINWDYRGCKLHPLGRACVIEQSTVRMLTTRQ